MIEGMHSEVRKVMVKKVVTVSPKQKLAEAARLMERKRIGSVVVTKDSRVVGIITERDFIRIASAGYDTKKSLVGDYMTRNPLVCKPSTKIIEVLGLMSKKRVRHLPVVAGNRKLVGIVTLRDLAAASNLIALYLYRI